MKRRHGVLAMSLLSISVASASAVEPVWITTPTSQWPACPMFRREFKLPSAPQQALLRIVGLGHYELRVNGQRAGDALIRQAWSQYDKTIYFDEIDLSPWLRAGNNAIGVILGNSFWYSPPAPQGRYQKGGPETDFGTPYLLRVELDVEAVDGTQTYLISDGQWRTSPSPVTFSHVFGGEDWDARLDQAGWDRPDFDDQAWAQAVPAQAPSGKLAKQFWPPLRPKQVFAAKRFEPAGAGKYHAFFEQNAAAVLRFTVEGLSGQSFTIQPSEYLTEAGGFLAPKWGAPCLFKYTLKGEGREKHQWLFHYHGFQAVEISGAVPPDVANPHGLPVLRTLEMVAVHTDLTEAGTFRTSSKLYNDIHKLVDWAIRSNMTYVMTDCPHREKLGWLECAYLLAPSFSFRYDARDWMTKITRDIREAQEPSGRILTVAPSYPGTRFPDAFHWTLEWGAAGVLLPWHHYVWYGDAEILRDNYDCMKRFVDYVASTSKDGIAPAGLGDWYDYGHGQPPGPSRFTPTELTSTAVQVMCIDAVIKAAEVLSNADDAARYRTLRESTASAFHKRFYDPAAKKFANAGSPQCAHTIALVAGLVPEADKQAVLDAVIADLKSRDWQQTPGDVGHVFFIRALAEAGRSDVLHRVYSREGLGSYGGILKKGMTSMPETWDAISDGSQSLNHCMLGHIMEWFYSHVAGIRQQEGSTGWRRVLIAPVPGALTEVNAAYDSPVGRIVSHWTVKDGEFVLKAEVPEGVSAELVGPDGSRKEVQAGQHSLKCAYRAPAAVD